MKYTDDGYLYVYKLNNNNNKAIIIKYKDGSVEIKITH
jgi:hypothetical protein